MVTPEPMMPTYQGIAPWMLWVAVVAGVVLCVAIAAVWKVIEINRSEKKRKHDEIAEIASNAVDKKVEEVADDISKKISDSFKDQFDSVYKKLDADKTRIEAQERRSMEHDRALERIESTLDNVDSNIRDMREGFTCLARGTIASLNHQIHNGNSDELVEAAAGLNKYLTARPVVPM